MGIFDFLKKKIEKKEIKIENVEYSDLTHNLSDKEKRIKQIKREIIDTFIEKKHLFISDLNTKIVILEKLTLENVKEHPKIKHLVLLNRDLYVKDIRRLLSNIDGGENLSFENFKDKIEKSFVDFKQNSEMKYRKATHLIGKEIAQVNDSINLFFKDYSQTIETNSNIISDSIIIKSLRKRMSDMSDYDKDLKEFKHKIVILEKELKENTKNSKELENEIDIIKKSDEYLSNLENIKKEKKISHEIEHELLLLKQSIDFKSLSKIFHGSKRYEQIVNEFRENFSDNYKLDNGLKLFELISEAKIENIDFKSKIENINKHIQEINKIGEVLIEDKTKKLEEDVKHIASKIHHLNEDKEKENKLLNKIKDEKQELLSQIKEELTKINISLND